MEQVRLHSWRQGERTGRCSGSICCGAAGWQRHPFSTRLVLCEMAGWESQALLACIAYFARNQKLNLIWLEQGLDPVLHKHLLHPSAELYHFFSP